MNSSPPVPSDDQRNSKIAVTGMLFLLLLIAGLGLKPGHNHTMLEDSLQTTGHFVFFGGLAICSALASPFFLPWLKSHRWAQYAFGLCISIGIGGLLEFAQKFVPGRYANVQDLIYDASGAIGAIGLLIFIHHVGRKSFQSKAIQLGGAAVFVATLLHGARPFVSCVLDYWQRKQAMPLLVDFREPWTSRFVTADHGAVMYKTNPPEQWTGSENVALLRIRPGHRYPGVTMREPFPNWQDYKNLVIDVLSPTNEDFEIRIEDIQHNDDYYDRFNRSVPITKGFQTIRIPIEDIKNGPRYREIDLSRMGGFKLFTVDPQHAIELYIGDVRLE